MKTVRPLSRAEIISARSRDRDKAVQELNALVLQSPSPTFDRLTVADFVGMAGVGISARELEKVISEYVRGLLNIPFINPSPPELICVVGDEIRFLRGVRYFLAAPMPSYPEIHYALKLLLDSALPLRRSSIWEDQGEYKKFVDAVAGLKDCLAAESLGVLSAYKELPAFADQVTTTAGDLLDPEYPYGEYFRACLNAREISY